ncbi:hypothetical protein DRN73_07450 [Candidatus Pacearchaeota archaeon]|nr:MAG: hypothetical protein DRN73_07450 [Candidatus Pacearchaeota archaeon]
MNLKEWEGRKVYIITKHGRYYSGKVKKVDLDSLPIIWITLIDKFGKIVQFTSSEIAEIREKEDE